MRLETRLLNIFSALLLLYCVLAAPISTQDVSANSISREISYHSNVSVLGTTHTQDQLRPVSPALVRRDYEQDEHDIPGSSFDNYREISSDRNSLTASDAKKVALALGIPVAIAIGVVALIKNWPDRSISRPDDPGLAFSSRVPDEDPVPRYEPPDPPPPTYSDHEAPPEYTRHRNTERANAVVNSGLDSTDPLRVPSRRTGAASAGIANNPVQSTPIRTVRVLPGPPTVRGITAAF